MQSPPQRSQPARNIMAIWKKASSVFAGGTEQVKKLKGRRIRALVNLELAIYDPINGKQAITAISQGETGLVSNHHPTTFDFLLAFPSNTSTLVTSLDALMRTGKFKVVVVNEPTFKAQFEIEG